MTLTRSALVLLLIGGLVRIIRKAIQPLCSRKGCL